MSPVPRPSVLIALIAVLLAVPLTVSCGKKGAPTLRSFGEPPPVPALRALHREDEITLSWDYPAGARAALKGFSVERDETAGPGGSGGSPGFRIVGSLGTDASRFVDRDSNAGKHYLYRVRAVSLRGVHGGYSPVLDVSPLEPPPAPQSLHAAAGKDFVEISWERVAGDVLYSVFRRFAADPYPAGPRNASPLTEPRFRDTVETGQPVYYTVQAFRRTPLRDEGPVSGELEVNPSSFVPAAPTGLTAVAAEGVVFLLWAESPEQWVRGYRIYRKGPSGPSDSVLGFSLTPAFKDREPLSTPAEYCVSAVGPGQESSGRECTEVIPSGER